MPSVTIENDSLCFRFPEVHKEALLKVAFQRTLRIPDDDKTYLLPPGLGEFPLRDVDQYADRIPARWAERGGVMLPMYQSEALWIAFNSDSWPSYPFAVKVTTGGVCALTAEVGSAGMHRDPQNYVAIPEQPWLDGYNIGGDTIRQFVAAPLDHEASVEQQVTGEAREGGMELEVFPMTAEAWKKHRPEGESTDMGAAVYGCAAPCCAEPDMGFAAGGKMRQEIYEDPYELDEWSKESVACRIHVCNSLAWRAITHESPPTEPPGPEAYKRAGFPFFDYYDDAKLIAGSKKLASLRSYKRGNESVEFSPERIVELRRIHELEKCGVRILVRTGDESVS